MALQQLSLSVLWISLGTPIGWEGIPQLLRQYPCKSLNLIQSPNFAAGVEALASTVMDVVLMTVGHGEPALEAVGRLHAVNRECPILVLGMIDDVEVAERLREAGAADYLASGHFDGPLLCRAIQYAVKHATDLKEMRDTLSQSTACCVP